MPSRKPKIAPVFLMLSVVGMGLSTSVLSVAAQTTTTVPSKTTTAPLQRRSQSRIVERHPEMRAALIYLQKARAELQQGAHDFKGERVEALKSTENAIAEVQQALRNDKY